MDTALFKELNRHTHIMVVHDSIFNSVFDSQVIKPLELYAKAHPTQRIIIISFEKENISAQQTAHIIPPSFHFIPLIKHTFMGLWTLAWAAYTLKNILSGFRTYDIIARGPIAGYLAFRAQTPDCTHLTIQARGLLAEEYGYMHKKCRNPVSMLCHAIRKQLYYLLEKNTYSLMRSNLTFEAVSPALQKYLTRTFTTKPERIAIAANDIPQSFSPETISIWREKIRNLLKIRKDTYVYCYNGSAKPWQCPDKVVQFFSEKLKNNTNVLLLILSQDIDTFLTILKEYHIANNHYRVLHIKHTEMYAYLAAADAGVLFREPHIINWVSRPTKALEYRALNLTIIQNNTVAYLVEETCSSSPYNTTT